MYLGQRGGDDCVQPHKRGNRLLLSLPESASLKRQPVTYDNHKHSCTMFSAVTRCTLLATILWLKMCFARFQMLSVAKVLRHTRQSLQSFAVSK